MSLLTWAAAPAAVGIAVAAAVAGVGVGVGTGVGAVAVSTSTSGTASVAAVVVQGLWLLCTILSGCGLLTVHGLLPAVMSSACTAKHNNEQQKLCWTM